MKLQSRLTHNFVEIKVDEIETTVWKSDPKEVDDMIYNLTYIIEDLSSLTNRTASITIDNDE